MFYNLENYHSILLFQELGKYNLKINVITIEKYRTFNIKQSKEVIIYYGLPFAIIDSNHFWSGLLDNLVINIG